MTAEGCSTNAAFRCAHLAGLKAVLRLSVQLLGMHQTLEAAVETNKHSIVSDTSDVAMAATAGNGILQQNSNHR